MRIDPAALGRTIGSLSNLDGEAGLATAVQRVVDVGARLVGADEAGMMVMDADGNTMLWASASDPAAQFVEERQERTAQGPCVDAFLHGVPSFTVDLRADPRWADLSGALSGQHTRGALSVPVAVAGAVVGTFDLYTTEPHHWEPIEIGAAQALAGVLSALVTFAVSADSSERLSGQLQRALDNRVLIEQAKGMLMEREGIGPAAAFERIRARARSSSRQASAVAGEILQTGRSADARLAEAKRRLAMARAAERAAHDRAASLHDEVAALRERLGDVGGAEHERERARFARKRMRDAAQPRRRPGSR
jgi:hypothetical protein